MAAAEPLGARQRRFTLLLAKLIEWAYANGYELTLGEAWRPEWVAAEYARRGIGVVPSFHTSRCAIDLNVFRGGTWLKDGGEFADLGAFWESLDKQCSWGGRFRKPDGTHFSMGESVGKHGFHGDPLGS